LAQSGLKDSSDDKQKKSTSVSKMGKETTTKERVLQRLQTVLVPAARRSIVGLNMIRNVTVNNGRVEIKIASTGLIQGAQEWINNESRQAVAQLPEVTEIDVIYEDVKAKELNEIDNTIAIMSGKGGVGKSLISSLMAVSLRRKGLEVGILDADITGPSIPKMFNLKNLPSGNESGILPILTRSGIEVMSINLLLPSDDDAVIWRGPMIGKAITQFGEDVLWGKLDYLIIDLPPGTADAPLTVMQTFQITGIVIVFTPQDLVEMIVRKAVNMARKMEKRILGIVENMSYLYITELDKRIEVFGKSNAEQMATKICAPLLGQLPIDPELAKLCDTGNIELYQNDIVNNLGDSLLQEISTISK
jgi:hydrogenase maturation protease